MHWFDEGYLLSKNNYSENSIIIEAFTSKHGKYTGIVYGGTSSKQKRNFQVGNKILLNWKSKNENRHGYFTVELVKPVSPLFFDDKKKIACILSATSILKLLLPDRQINEKIYNSFEKLINNLTLDNWINFYIHWELSLIKELGFEINFLPNKKIQNEDIIKINDKKFKIPKLILNNKLDTKINNEIKEALIFNKNLLLENFIIPIILNFPLFRNMLEKYYS